MIRNSDFLNGKKLGKSFFQILGKTFLVQARTKYGQLLAIFSQASGVGVFIVQD